MRIKDTKVLVRRWPDGVRQIYVASIDQLWEKRQPKRSVDFREQCWCSVDVVEVGTQYSIPEGNWMDFPHKNLFLIL